MDPLGHCGVCGSVLFLEGMRCMSRLRACRLRLAQYGLVLAGVLGPLAGCSDNTTTVAPIPEAETKAQATAQQDARRKAYGGSGTAVGKKGGLAQPKSAPPAEGAGPK